MLQMKFTTKILIYKTENYVFLDFRTHKNKDKIMNVIASRNFMAKAKPAFIRDAAFAHH